MREVVRIALVGYRATGKTTLGALVARRINWSFVDMDEMLTGRFGMSISSWVSKHGWDSFRKQESALLQELSQKRNLVVATGGGIVEDPKNRTLLRNAFFVFWLRAQPREISRRLVNDSSSTNNRPSLTGMGITEEVETVLKRREPFYRSVAHAVIDTDDSDPTGLADRVIELINHFSTQFRR
ncbi:shikimate kinase [Thermodesulforhabdus norvegica]|uniref:Shikimate kinase n=1 Tax=Thermodesulforhabdus norvegica TaxID=39841 RepID=A0A1I4W1L1_9BACT|nr:shikimate kinase [Thermodesulforhabdus norvegica]SFN07362.1 shikimate kinase [Thermodesulforhabdus norvegica]